MSPLAHRTSARPVGSGGGRGVAGHNVGTFLQHARSGRGCSARASAGDRAVAAHGGLASLSRLLGSSPHYRRRRSVPATRGRRCRKAAVVRDYLFLRQTQVAKYFNRTPWQVSVTGGLHSPLVGPSVAPALPAAAPIVTRVTARLRVLF